MRINSCIEVTLLFFQGAYECEDVPDAPDLPHVAAWDHPRWAKMVSVNTIVELKIYMLF